MNNRYCIGNEALGFEKNKLEFLKNLVGNKHYMLYKQGWRTTDFYYVEFLNEKYETLYLLNFED